MSQTSSTGSDAPIPLIHSAGYFTCLRYVLDMGATELARRIGFSHDALGQGWDMYRPAHPIPASILVLQGTTRFSDGVMPNGQKVEPMLARRYEGLGKDLSAARAQVAAFFLRSPDLTPVKLVPLKNRSEVTYPPGEPIGLPQFRLLAPIGWRWLKRYDGVSSVRISDIDG